MIKKNRVVDTPFDILSKTWSHDSVNSLTTNQQSQIITFFLSSIYYMEYIGRL